MRDEETIIRTAEEAIQKILLDLENDHGLKFESIIVGTAPPLDVGIFWSRPRKPEGRKGK